MRYRNRVLTPVVNLGMLAKQSWPILMPIAAVQQLPEGISP